MWLDQRPQGDRKVDDLQEPRFLSSFFDMSRARDMPREEERRNMFGELPWAATFILILWMPCSNLFDLTESWPRNIGVNTPLNSASNNAFFIESSLKVDLCFFNASMALFPGRSHKTQVIRELCEVVDSYLQEFYVEM